jgi:hypothetical protein
VPEKCDFCIDVILKSMKAVENIIEQFLDFICKKEKHIKAWSI